jgi:hypothetical protein
LLSTGADASQVNLFGLVAVAGLAGMFSKQAIDKLREVFDNLFRTATGTGDVERSGKLVGHLAVAEKMIPINKITAYRIPAGQTAEHVKILDIYEKYGGVVTRLPVLSSDDAVLHVIHQSLVYKFISAESVAAARQTQAFDPNTLTLRDFLGFEDMSSLVTDSIAFVPETACISEAKRKMEDTPRCQDVFVTATGERTEPVRGWLTNVDIGRLSTA